jgi:hypothetical protein
MTKKSKSTQQLFKTPIEQPFKFFDPESLKALPTSLGLTLNYLKH